MEVIFFDRVMNREWSRGQRARSKEHGGEGREVKF